MTLDGLDHAVMLGPNTRNIARDNEDGPSARIHLATILAQNCSPCHMRLVDVLLVIIGAGCLTAMSASIVYSVHHVQVHEGESWLDKFSHLLEVDLRNGKMQIHSCITPRNEPVIA
jgi:hypothetical protein